MTKPKSVDDVLNDVNAQDALKRKKLEQDLLLDAKSLMNGNTGCPVTMGRVLNGLAELSVQTHEMSRNILAALPSLQKKEDCVLVHTGRFGKVTVFGQTYKVPLSVAILVTGVLIYLRCRESGLM